MKLYVDKIGKPEAQMMLADMVEYNREIDWGWVAKLARDMASDSFKLTGDTIKRDVDGYWFDGEHRLRALIEADAAVPGIMVEFAFAIDAPRDAYQAVDIGKGRSATAMAKMLTKGRFTGKAMPMVKWYWQYSMGNPLGRGGRWSANPTRAQEIELYATDANGFENSWLRGKDLFKKGIGNARVGALFHYLLKTNEKIGPEETERFYTPLVSGVDIPKGSYIGALRDRLMAGRRSPGGHRFAGYRPFEELYFYHRAWRGYCLDEKTSRLVLPKIPGGLSNSTFPKLYTPGSPVESEEK